MEYTFTFNADELDIISEALNSYHMEQYRILKEVKAISEDAAKQIMDYINEIEKLNDKLHEMDAEE